uniref:SP13 phlebotomine family member n=1 Tax=Nyssomyia intermedia TaxID=182990 RepID=J7HBS4_9DIPT
MKFILITVFVFALLALCVKAGVAGVPEMPYYPKPGSYAYDRVADQLIRKYSDDSKGTKGTKG